DVAVSLNDTRPDGSRELIDAAVEVGHAREVEDDLAQIALLAAQQRDDAVDGPLDLRRRLAGHRAGETLLDAHPRARPVRIRQVDTGKPALVPHDGANTDWGFEK